MTQVNGGIIPPSRPIMALWTWTFDDFHFGAPQKMSREVAKDFTFWVMFHYGRTVVGGYKKLAGWLVDPR